MGKYDIAKGALPKPPRKKRIKKTPSYVEIIVYGGDGASMVIPIKHIDADAFDGQQQGELNFYIHKRWMRGAMDIVTTIARLRVRGNHGPLRGS